MARIARVVAAGVPHHLTQRGNRRQIVFFKDSDFENYLTLMAEWCKRCGVFVWAYCLMPNHVHLVAVPKTADSLARAIGEAHRRYTRLINFREGWRGYLWQGRFASYALDEHYLLAVVRYIELNPVRAGLVEDAWRYRWSSCRPHLKGKDDLLVRVKPMLELVDDWRDYLRYDDDPHELESIRCHTRTGRPLGNEDFIEALEDRLGRILRPRKPGPKNYRTKF